MYMSAYHNSSSSSSIVTPDRKHSDPTDQQWPPNNDRCSEQQQHQQHQQALLQQQQQQQQQLSFTTQLMGSHNLSDGIPQNHSLSCTPNYAAQQGIVTVHENDVLCGRGVFLAQHPGNQRFRSLVKTYLDDSFCSSYTTSEKRAAAKDIIAHIYALKPPGRFLKRDTTTRRWTAKGLEGPWKPLSHREVLKKATQALRDCNRQDRQGYASNTPSPLDVAIKTKTIQDSGLTAKQRASNAAKNDTKPPPQQYSPPPPQQQQQQQYPYTNQQQEIIPMSEPPINPNDYVRDEYRKGMYVVPPPPPPTMLPQHAPPTFAHHFNPSSLVAHPPPPPPFSSSTASSYSIPPTTHPNFFNNNNNIKQQHARGTSGTNNLKPCAVNNTINTTFATQGQNYFPFATTSATTPFCPAQRPPHSYPPPPPPSMHEPLVANMNNNNSSNVYSMQQHLYATPAPVPAFDSASTLGLGLHRSVTSSSLDSHYDTSSRTSAAVSTMSSVT